ncbi:class I SAM-dependent DNA methyltransferase [Wenzhouxiangella sp. AB-CW3]|uniref:class I SAM-dependent DNA methyltransferase n=1 Tax=Wenzhouxiangella sp. AB-CW3 TaxID=2771012 RepID=UPI00168A67D3|nr:class I SAM-dependent DNA methyltransferase [Wenzhouxiangella sp. AB-CW3]QOC23239.1 class I SAM-dependent DNA methyltransferase [Wenzhouxiangella sp. AB-CW3]
MNDTTNNNETPIDQFITRWQNTGGKERANYQLFLTELCQLLDLPGPQPASDDPAEDEYVFEHRVDIRHPDGTESRGYIDLYKRGHFVLEAKRVTEDHASSRWDKAMLRAAAQADTYIRALPAGEGRPPFLLTCDVGKTIEVYSEFSRSGGTYVPFPDARSHRIHLEDLQDESVRERLRHIWTDPDSLDPSKRAARVTRELSRTLATLARALEKDGYQVERVAHFIKRCLFTMFCEDVGLLPRGQFTALLERLKKSPDNFPHALRDLWETMNTGGYSGVLNEQILRFNGSLFTEINPIPLNAEQIQLLIDAARHDWSEVEPAIFGTLLERALDPEERHKLGAHYTPRAYVERLVMPTVIDPLRDEWKDVQAAAAALEAQDKHKKAVEEIRNFHRKLCDIRILDPACGSGNFLYVTLEHMKRLEGEVLTTLADLGEGQNLLEMQGNTVDPHQFLGLEINPRAAAIAEMVLWIGYLQWHFRTHGHINPPQPVLRAFENIECRDAVLAYDRWEYKMDEETGRPVMRWDGKTYKKSPTTGEDIPDESAQVPEEVYINPRKAEWPETDYVIGNPPFIGAASMRRALGDGYVDALRKTWKEVPESSDFVIYWWNKAADLARNGKIKQFGLITTNSLRQTFNRRIIERHMNEKKPLSLVFAIPDHPWVDGADGAAVRIAMTVGAGGEYPGVLGTLNNETKTDDETRLFEIRWRVGKLHANLTAGADLPSAIELQANGGVSSRGVQLIGPGFIVEPDQARKLGLGDMEGVERIIREYRNGRDLTKNPRGVLVIDLFHYTSEEARKAYPAIYQWVQEKVKPERDQNNRKGYREKWWIFGEPRREWRKASEGLSRYIATVETSKHRFFQFLDESILPDNMLVCIATDQVSHLGILSSRLHMEWALRMGGTLEDRPRYNKTRCFETFPFPAPDEATANRIATLAEQLDTHRKRQQEQHPGLTMTGMYNVLEKLRREEELTKKEKEIHEQGLVSVLRELHDDLDRAVFQAYGWEDLADKLVGRPGATTPWPEKPEEQQEAEEELLQRLVDLNHQRAAEEAQGKIRWLRPDYQAPEETATQAELATEQPKTAAKRHPGPDPGPKSKLPWPKSLQAQIRAVRDQLAAAPMDPQSLASHYKRKPEKSVTQVLEALTELGMVRQSEDGAFRLREN